MISPIWIAKNFSLVFNFSFCNEEMREKSMAEESKGNYSKKYCKRKIPGSTPRDSNLT